MTTDVRARYRGSGGGDLARREAILDAATALFGRQGFSTTTMDEVAEAADVAKRTLYRYMGSKDGILVAIHERFLDRSTMEIVSQALSSAPEQLLHFVHHHTGVVAKHQREIRVFVEEMKHLPDDAREHVVFRRDAYEGILRGVLQRGIDDGDFRAVDVPIVAQAILGALTNMYRWYDPDGSLSASEIAGHLGEMFLNGICARGNRSSVAAVPVTTEISANCQAMPSPWDTNPVLSRILDAATTLFYEEGYHEATTRELAEASGLTKGALYYYIGQKEAALFQVHQKVTNKGIESLSRVLAEGGPPVPTLRQLIHEHCVIMEDYQQAIAVFSDEMKFLSPEHLDEVVKLRRVYTALWRRALENGVAAGTFKAPHLTLTTMSLLGLLNYMSLWYRPGGRLGPTQIAEQFADLIFYGLLVDDSDS